MNHLRYYYWNLCINEYFSHFLIPISNPSPIKSQLNRQKTGLRCNRPHGFIVMKLNRTEMRPTKKGHFSICGHVFSSARTRVPLWNSRVNSLQIRWNRQCEFCPEQEFNCTVDVLSSRCLTFMKCRKNCVAPHAFCFDVLAGSLKYYLCQFSLRSHNTCKGY